MMPGMNIEKGRKVCVECQKRIRDRYYSIGGRGPLCMECYLTILNEPGGEKTAGRKKEPQEDATKE